MEKPSPEDLKKGYKDVTNEPSDMDETPTNSQWRDLDDVGFCGRPKGSER